MSASVGEPVHQLGVSCIGESKNIQPAPRVKRIEAGLWVFRSCIAEFRSRSVLPVVYTSNTDGVWRPNGEKNAKFTLLLGWICSTFVLFPFILKTEWCRFILYDFGAKRIDGRLPMPMPVPHLGTLYLTVSRTLILLCKPSNAILRLSFFSTY